MLHPIEMRLLALLELVGEEMVPESHHIVCSRQQHTDCRHNARRRDEVITILAQIRDKLEKEWAAQNEHSFGAGLPYWLANALSRPPQL